MLYVAPTGQVQEFNGGIEDALLKTAATLQRLRELATQKNYSEASADLIRAQTRREAIRAGGQDREDASKLYSDMVDEEVALLKSAYPNYTENDILSMAERNVSDRLFEMDRIWAKIHGGGYGRSY